MAILQQKIEVEGLIKSEEFSPNAESPPKALKSPPKCSTPKGSPPPFSFTDDSSSGDSNNSSSTSSGAEICANTYLASSTKKKKIRQKVEAAMSDVESLVEEQGESLGELIAQSCLLKRNKKFCGKEMVSHDFIKVGPQEGTCCRNMLHQHAAGTKSC